MPYFLADSFKALVEDKHNKNLLPSESKQSLSNKSQNGGASYGSSNYKSEYLKEKQVDQAEKKKRDRKNKVKPVAKQGADKKGSKVVGEVNEDLVEVVGELKNDLLNKERDHEELVEKFKLLEARHSKLLTDMQKMKGVNIVLETKQRKQALQSELIENKELITGNKFFEEKANNLDSLNSCLVNSIKTQYKLSRKMSVVQKYALRWLEIVRERRRQRETEQFFKS